MKSRYLLLYIFLFVRFSTVYAQQVNGRVILFGDAGEINPKQEGLLHHAAAMVIPTKTHVFFLGDNIYEHGMPVDSNGRGHAEDIISKQFTPFRQAKAPVYFMAGNHDWDKSGPQGLEKVKAQEQFLQAQQDKDLHFIPKAGTTGPVAVPLTDHVVAIVYDSEYLLYPGNYKNTDLYNQALSRFTSDLDNLLQTYADQTVLLMCHHPMVSYGEHGLKFSWKQHLFPLTKKWRKFYLPLPVVGSAYPLLRATAFRSAEDLPHPVYKNLIQKVTAITEKYPQVIFISGHDHGLQFIEKNNKTQIVSGSGSKTSMIYKGKGLVYAYEKQGFCTLDLLDNSDLLLRYYIYENDTATQTFEKHLKR